MTPDIDSLISRVIEKYADLGDTAELAVARELQRVREAAAEWALSAGVMEHKHKLSPALMKVYEKEIAALRRCAADVLTPPPGAQPSHE